MIDKTMRKALEADAQKLREITGEEHTVIFICDAPGLSATCFNCDGTGNCPTCGGRGQSCPECEGTGFCQACS